MSNWFDEPEIAEALRQPAGDVLGEMQARTDALLARLHDERGPLVDIDPIGCDAWIASRDSEYDVEAA